MINDREGLAGLTIKEKSDQSARDESTGDYDGLNIVLAAVNRHRGFDVTLQRSVKEADVLWVYREEDLVLGAVSEGDLHVGLFVIVFDFILQPLEFDVTLLPGRPPGCAEEVEED